MRKSWNYMLKVPMQWWFSALTVCIGAIAGLFGSIYAPEIKGAVPFGWHTGPIVWPAVGFWILLVCFGLFFGLGFNAQNAAAKSGLDRLAESSNQLESLIRTLPPKGFLVAFEELFKVSFDVDAKAVEATDDQDALKASVVTALTGIAFLVKAFDSREDHPSYAVNVMLFRPIDQVTDSELQSQLRFAEPGQDRKALDGVLQVQADFAYVLSEDTPVLDANVPPVMLPIPRGDLRMDNGRSTILPGAPTVFCDPSQFAGFENTLQLATWCRDQSGLRPSVAEQIERYFAEGEGREIRSFICLPIVLSTPGGSGRAVLGVLNLHSNREAILPGEKGGLFVPLTTPFMLPLARSLAKLRGLSK